jgi:protein involved in polysaccharide export with SLBB domain
MAEMAPEINRTLHSDFDVVTPGDVLDVRFVDMVPDNKMWDHETTVRPDGKAAFLGLGDRAVGGLSLEAVRASIGADYQKLFGLRSADHFGLLSKVKVPRSVIVMGDVHNPGSIAYDGGRLTLLEAIGRAGGPLKETARLDSTLLVRWDPETRRQLAWKIDCEQEQWNSPVPIYLQPFDIVFLPNTSIDKVDIWVDQYIRRLLPIPVNVGAISATPAN